MPPVLTYLDISLTFGSYLKSKANSFANSSFSASASSIGKTFRNS